MSIATEITRLQNAKASIKSAIEGKGVNVPSATLLDGYSNLISSIPSGGSPSLQTKNITLGASAPSTVTADAGYDGLSSVPISLDNSIIKAENIAQGIQMLGITGTHQGGGGGATEPYIEETYNANGNLTNAVMHGHTKIRNDAFYECRNLASTSLPSGITSIGSYAFYECRNLALTSLPSGITSIGSYAFYECYNLASTSLPSGLTSIGSYAFYYCRSLALTSLPSGITSIGSYAFQKCTNLTSITFEGKPNTIASNAFSGCTNLTTINVPWASGEVANAPWGATNATINYNYTGV